MSVQVTMLQTRRGEDGTLWTAGTSHSATDAFAAYLIGANLATGTLPKHIRRTVYEPVFGNNSTDAAIDQADAIQAAISNCGYVSLVGEGDVYVHCSRLPLIIDSKTFLDVDDRLRIKAVGGLAPSQATGRSLIVSRQFVNRASGTSCTVAWTTGTEVTVTWTAHGKVVGTPLWFQDAVASGVMSAFCGIFLITSIVDANNFKAQLTRRPPVNATITSGTISGTTLTINSITAGGVDLQSHILYSGSPANLWIEEFLTGTGGAGTYRLSTAPGNIGPVAMTSSALGDAGSATITILEADRDTSVRGGIWDYNEADNLNNSDLLNRFAAIFAGYNCHFSDMVIEDSSSQCFILGACRDSTATNISAPRTGSGGWQLHGPAYNSHLFNLHGFGDDDGLAWVPRMQDDYVGYRWTVGDIINCSDTGTDWTTVQGSAVVVYCSPHQRMEANVTKLTGGLIPIADGVGVAVFGYDDKARLVSHHFEDLNVISDNQLKVRGRNSQAGTYGKISAKRIHFNPWSASGTVCYGFAQDTWATIKSLDIEVICDKPGLQAGQTHRLVMLQGPFGRADVKVDVQAIGQSTTRSVFLDTSAGGSGAVFRLHSSYVVGGDQVVGGAAATTLGEIIFDGNNLNASSIFGTGTGTTSNFGTVTFCNGNRLNGATLGILRMTGTPTLKVVSDGTNVLAGSSVWTVVTSGTPVLSVYGWDIAIDPIAVTGLATTAGQYCKSTQAGLEGGPAIRGSDGWYALATAVGGGNTAIT